MERHLISSRAIIVVFIVVAGLLLSQFGATPAKADLPTDGRINGLPWVNSWGAVAVYCVDQNGGHTSYHGGRIDVTNAAGQILLRVTEAQILKAGVNPQHDVLIASGPLYALYRQPDTYFRLESQPDAEGKTFIGSWHDCTPVNPITESGGACFEWTGSSDSTCQAVCVTKTSKVCSDALVPFGGDLNKFCDEMCYCATHVCGGNSR